MITRGPILSACLQVPEPPQSQLAPLFAPESYPWKVAKAALPTRWAVKLAGPT